MKYCLLIFIAFISCSDHKTTTSDEIPDFTTVFEKSKGFETATYWNVIDYYTDLAEYYPQIELKEMGETDSGEPLHLVLFNNDNTFDFSEIRKTDRIVFINNGIHPGEPDGIDATMMLFRDLANGTIKTPKNTSLAAIPIYNVGGSLNRNSTSRTNQNGPKSYGFRGNARNYDLNRDFIKSDTKNAKSFATIFHDIKPDVFIDNHVSNGADYQYTLTHLFTQHNKLGGSLGMYLHDQMMPKLESKLNDRTWDITPYVNVFNSVPEKGFNQFMDYPRYSTGYTTLWNTLGMMVETHMLKPYKQRVEGTYELMKMMIEITEEDGETIKKLRKNAFDHWKNSKEYPISWSVDTTRSSTLKFKGFEAEMIPSEITGKLRLKYDTLKPFIKDVDYQNYFERTRQVEIPDAYIIPQGWHNVIDLMQLNGVEMKILANDSLITVESYKIESYETRQNAYEGHYPHTNVNVISKELPITFRAGDVLIKTDQPAIRYLLETLEPEATDSFFSWNFFDTILQQKEGFSPYVWEDKAKELLDSNESIRNELEEKKRTDPKFSENWYAQLNWLHQKSENYELAHLQYPVYRILKK